MKNKMGAATSSVKYWREGSKDVLKFGPAMYLSGNTRRTKHDANRNQRFPASSRVRSLPENRENPLNLHQKKMQNRCHQPIGSLI